MPSLDRAGSWFSATKSGGSWAWLQVHQLQALLEKAYSLGAAKKLYPVPATPVNPSLG